MSELPEFLLARIAEDEEVAREAREHEYLDASRDSSVINWECDAIGYAFVATTSGRILAECEAKRKIVALLKLVDFQDGHRFPTLRDDPAQVGERAVALEALWALVSIYSDHPDYREEWKP